MPKPGLVISFEGLSASGKTSAVGAVTRMLEDRRKQVVVKGDLVNFRPEEGSVGFEIKAILDRAAPTFRLGFPMCETLLILAKRAFESQQRLEPALVRGAIVLCDRDVDTVCAYQLPVMRDARPFELDDTLVSWIRSINGLSTIVPTLTIFLKVSAELSLEREKGRSDRDPVVGDHEAYVSNAKRLEQCYERVLRAPMADRRLEFIETNGRTLDAVCGDAQDIVRQYLAQNGHWNE